MTKSKLTNRLQFTLETDFCSLKEIVSCKHEAAFPSIITPVCGGFVPDNNLIVQTKGEKAEQD